MDFSDFWVQNGKGKEQLKDTKHGVRKEQVDKKFHNLFDAYDANSDGTLEDNELQHISGHLKDLAGDNVLDANENQRATSIFAEQVGIQDADFQGFVKTVSKASEDIIESEEVVTLDGGKEIKTDYKDGTTETIAYYPNGDFKWKKIEKRFQNTTYEMEIDGQIKELTEEQYQQALKKMDEMAAQQKPQTKIKNQFGLENTLSSMKLNQAPQFGNSISVRSNTTRKETHDQKFSPRYIAEALGVDIHSENGKKIIERLSYLPEEAFDQIKNGAELKNILSSNELSSSFDNISNVLELLYGITLRDEEELEAAKPQREKIVNQIKIAEFLVELYSTVAEWNDEYTDSIGLFGLGSEGIGYLINKVGLDGENHYQWADSCREFAERASNLKVLNPEKFNEGFKNIYGKNSDECGISFNEKAFKELFAIIESGRAVNENNQFTDEYKAAILKATNFDADNPNESIYNQVMNGIGEALMMVATLGWSAEVKGGQILASSTMATFSKAGVSIASKHVNRKLLQGALRYSGQAVKLLGPAINEGTKMYAYTAVMGTVSNVANRVIKFDSEENSLEKFLGTEAMVLDNAKGSFGFGAFAGVFGSTVTQKVMQSASRVSKKVGTALSGKFAKGAVDANDVFVTILEKSAPTKIAEAAAFAADVLGFTAFETAMTLVNHMDGFPDNVTFEDVTKLLWEEFKGQGINLGQIKGISYLIMWMSGSRSARMQASKYMRENPQFKGATVEWVNGGKDGYKINLPDGRKIECKNTTEMISSMQLMSRGETAFSGKFDIRNLNTEPTIPPKDNHSELLDNIETLVDNNTEGNKPRSEVTKKPYYYFMNLYAGKDGSINMTVKQLLNMLYTSDYNKMVQMLNACTHENVLNEQELRKMIELHQESYNDTDAYQSETNIYDQKNIDYIRGRLLDASRLSDENLQLNDIDNTVEEQLSPTSKYRKLGQKVLNKKTQQMVYIFENLRDTPDFNGLRAKNPLNGGGSKIKYIESHLNKLKDAGITTIIDFRDPDCCSQKVLDLAKKMGFKYVLFTIDSTWSTNELTQMTQYIKAVNKGNFIAGCANGQARTDLGMAINYVFNPQAKNTPEFYYGNIKRNSRVNIRDSITKIFKALEEHPEFIKELGWPDVKTFETETMKRFSTICG